MIAVKVSARNLNCLEIVVRAGSDLHLFYTLKHFPLIQVSFCVSIELLYD